MSSRRVTQAESVEDRQFRAVLLLTFAVAAIVVGCWLWGAVAAATTGNPPPTNIGQSLLVIPRLLLHPSKPAQAWGAGSASMPAGIVIWGVFVGLLAVAVAAAVALTRVGRARRWSTPAMLRRRSRFAEWARLRDLRPLVVQPNEHPGRIALGTFAGHLLAGGEEASVLVVGTTRSGKTSGMLMPALLEHVGPAIATSVKEDLLQTLPYRRSIGEVRIFDPTGAITEATSGWSPVAAARDWRAARRVAHRLLSQGGIDSDKNGEFWLRSGVRLLAPLLLAAHIEKAGMGLVLSWLEDTDHGAVEEAVTEALEQHRNTGDGERALSQVKSVWNLEPRTLSNVHGTIAAALEPYQDTEVREKERTTPITPEWLLSGNNTVFIIAPAHEQARLRGLIVAMLTDLIDSAYEHAARQPGGRLSPSLLLALDEVANIAALSDLDQIASTGAGAGIKLLSGVQNVAQLQERWGHDKAETILANHVARIFAGGIADEAGLNYLRTVAGEEEIDSVSRSDGGSHDAQRTYGTTFRPLIDGPVARQMRDFDALLIYGRLPTARIQLRPWFKDKRLRERVEHSAIAPVAR